VSSHDEADRDCAHDDHAVIDGCWACVDEEQFHIACRDCGEADICPLDY